MRSSFAFAVFIAALLAAACVASTEEAPTDGSWVGTINTEGNVTTVINESGSVWGGAATLVEEVSIGVEAGPEEYMFGEIVAVYATERHIYVSDRPLPRVRQYTLDGLHVRDLGGAGQGPGEYLRPGAIIGGGGGRIFVQASSNGRFNVYTEAGDVLDSWPAPQLVCCTDRMAVDQDGGLLAIVWSEPELELPRDTGVQAHGPDGPYGPVRVPEPVPYEVVTIDVNVGGIVMTMIVPFSPWKLFTLAPSGDTVVGAGDRYRFEVRAADGSALVVERYWSPTPVVAPEAEWARRSYVAGMRTLSPGFVWDGAEMPATKPAMYALLPQLGGDVLVVRPGPGERLDDCVEDPLADFEAARAEPCWRESMIWDAFGSDGRYLGEIKGAPPVAGNLGATVFKRDEMLLVATEDEAGTIMVKRYRLVLPGSR